MARVRFALEMLGARWNAERRLCPYCGSRLHQRLQRKKVLLEARQCHFCGLIFRWPTADPARAQRFYENDYKGQQATDVPSETELGELTASSFRGSRFDKSHRLPILRRIVTDGRLLDFGCSWGYSLVQWQAAGYDVVGFEYARNRARLGREQLGLDIRDDFGALASEPDGCFDIVYVDHVVEHLPRLREPIELFSRLLRPGGVLLIFVPNGGGALARRLGTGWGPFLGETHTVALTAEWFHRNLPSHGFAPRCFSSGADPDEAWPSPQDGEELVCEARRLE